MILAPLRGVTIRCFRKVFEEQIAEAGFTEALTPFIPALTGFDPFKDRELSNHQSPTANHRILLTPQFIGKDPAALRDCLRRVRDAGYETADLNCGCPFPMVRGKGRGSGLLRTSDVLARLLEVGCDVMGPSRFSVKARLGVDRTDELLGLMPMLNGFPLRFLTVHARTARQMYTGACDWRSVEAIESVAAMPVVRNGDLPLPASGQQPPAADIMVGRGFIRALGERGDSVELLRRYIRASQDELSGDAPVLGRMKELLSYWKGLPFWRRRWDVVKICRSVDELLSAIS